MIKCSRIPRQAAKHEEKKSRKTVNKEADIFSKTRKTIMAGKLKRNFFIRPSIKCAHAINKTKYKIRLKNGDRRRIKK